MSLNLRIADDGVKYVSSRRQVPVSKKELGLMHQEQEVSFAKFNPVRKWGTCLIAMGVPDTIPPMIPLYLDDPTFPDRYVYELKAMHRPSMDVTILSSSASKCLFDSMTALTSRSIFLCREACTCIGRSDILPGINLVRVPWAVVRWVAVSLDGIPRLIRTMLSSNLGDIRKIHER